jgi:hypothetical protein
MVNQLDREREKVRKTERKRKTLSSNVFPSSECSGNNQNNFPDPYKSHSTIKSARI